ncbi:protein of unknown function DUF55 [Methanospirillum hungatei JF-1]|jgi:predicted RNA-binding protein|uniref:EVE domain-containing protein n=1 Tax=Methanospirillum hungatei JF-1 (strain ATCC 27890 / DSM 864 / NBRC 100397 / JF-1) TaxID=323259 RepID=Q2FP01_METHJ|nr:EVE domain-containing protein [Methanospirillum hungatei]ABD41248.1 protein of unknown function DUF55 [Methanospirillum hungatei JF-1]
MSYWIASSNRPNWEIIRNNDIWGVPKRNKSLLTRVAPGDKILIYVRAEQHGNTLLPSAITGAFQVEKCFEDQSRLFIPPPQMGDEIFPYRFQLKPVNIFKEPVEFKPLINDLKFITNKTMWSGHLRVAMREIPEEDFLLIMNKSK